jgi:hypothetical protein
MSMYKLLICMTKVHELHNLPLENVGSLKHKVFPSFICRIFFYIGNLPSEENPHSSKL